MAYEFTLTPGPYRQTTPGSTVYQPVWTSVDVLSFDLVDIEMGVLGFEGTLTSPLVTIAIYTSLQMENDSSGDGWFSGFQLSFSAVNTFQAGSLVLAGGSNGYFLRYLRWGVLSGGTWWGTQSAATFWVKGVARLRHEVGG